VLWRFLSKPVIFDPLDLGSPVTGKVPELANRIAFRDPKPEPRTFPESFGRWFAPDKSFKATPALESLLMSGGFSKATCSAKPAKWASFFLAFCCPLSNGFDNRHLNMPNFRRKRAKEPSTHFGYYAHCEERFL
jgi:hypothetical protein